MQQCIALAATALLAALLTYAVTISRAQTKRQVLEKNYGNLLAWYNALYVEVHELRQALAEERRLRADLVKWIEIECRRAGGKECGMVESALKQRIEERLEVMRTLREQLRQQQQAAPQPPPKASTQAPPPQPPSPPA